MRENVCSQIYNNNNIFYLKALHWALEDTVQCIKMKKKIKTVRNKKQIRKDNVDG